MKDCCKFDLIFQGEPTWLLLSQSRDQLPAIIKSAFKSASSSIEWCLVNDKLLISDLLKYVNKTETSLLLWYSDENIQHPWINIDWDYIVKLRGETKGKYISFIIIDWKSFVLRNNDSHQKPIFFSNWNKEILKQLEDKLNNIK